MAKLVDPDCSISELFSELTLFSSHTHDLKPLQSFIKITTISASSILSEEPGTLFVHPSSLCPYHVRLKTGSLVSRAGDLAGEQTKFPSCGIDPDGHSSSSPQHLAVMALPASGISCPDFTTMG